MRLCILGLVIVSSVLSAPAPLKQKRESKVPDVVKEADVVGNWDHTWLRLRAVVLFTKDGQAFATYGNGHTSTGTWKLVRTNVVQWIEDGEEYELDVSPSTLANRELSGGGYFICDGERILECERYTLNRQKE